MQRRRHSKSTKSDVSQYAQVLQSHNHYMRILLHSKTKTYDENKTKKYWALYNVPELQSSHVDNAP